MAESSSQSHPYSNRLVHSSSPYLLQHAHNPVDWYPWGPQAIETALKLDRPIFLSVGYSTCYWCHVMERQSFENEQIAAEMNDKFICIKVDREERPDVDQLYMIAVQILTRQGGWPMSVFLTPKLRPFFGGTYFPPTDSYGRPGFPRVLGSISAAYHNKRDQVERSADEIVRMIEQVSEPRAPIESLRVDLDWVESLIERSTADYEQCYGGFGGAPKFPRQTLLETLLAYTASPHATDDAQQIKSQVLYTLDFMAEGGIRDQLGGGFHRYSTDEKWLVPHFEIMLYDNAMLAVVYTEAFQQTQNNTYAQIARGILDFTMREMTTLRGAFYTAFDAEVDAQEGLTYLWTADEVREVLERGSGVGVQGSANANVAGSAPASSSLNPEPQTLNPSSTPFSKDDIQLFLDTYGLSAGPNFADPHHGAGQPDKNILYLPRPLSNVAKSMNLTPEQLESRLAPMRAVLLDARQGRKQPMLDTKVLTSWNALMLRALAIAGQMLNEPRYIQAAEKVANFLLRFHRQENGRLIRTSRPDRKSTDRDQPVIPGFLDDYAFLANGLLALHRATGNEQWKQKARDIANVMKDLFLDNDRGAFYFTPADSSDLIVRQKVGADSPLPSGNAIAARVLMELDEPHLARQVLAVFAQSLEDQAEGMSSMLGAALEFLHHHDPFSVSTAGAPQDRPQTPDEQAKAAVQLMAEWQSPTHLRIAIEIMESYHINTDHPAQGLIPTTLSIYPPRGVALNPTITYPPGEMRSLPFATELIALYEGVVIIEVELAQPPPPKTPLRATITYQPCTNEACLSATSKEIKIISP